MKYCKDCKHYYSSSYDIAVCKALVKESPDLVEGGVKYSPAEYCDTMRNSNRCGERGRLWEEK